MFDQIKPNLELYQEYLNYISQGNCITITEKENCNIGKFYKCITKEQLDFVILKLFESKKNQAITFKKQCEESTVYDGLIFALTDSILQKAIDDDKIEYKLAYIVSFGFIGDGVFFKKEILNKEEYEKLTKYPFGN
jgi:hypothetical protein